MLPAKSIARSFMKYCPSPKPDNEMKRGSASRLVVIATHSVSPTCTSFLVRAYS